MSRPRPPVWGGRLMTPPRRELLARMAAASTGMPQEPIYRAAAADEVAVTWLARPELPNLAKLRQAGLPAVVVLGDDDYRTSGPSGWPAADKALSWAKAAVIHAAGGRPEHYAAAVADAQRFGRLVLIETADVAADDWILAAKEAGIVNLGAIRVPPGGCHPADASPHALRDVATTLFLPGGDPNGIRL